ncbi:NADP-specific glutamate dehydrogenase [Desulfotignum phosphitoxidans]|jgi:glutamate dehydrogenase (NADP+)|uniref:Glutamate dehydrogenase n=1 Tax=Desulfotignum phosphitoxidans DSM 13687 TaxID=1286635 RepID=S0G4R6_9BACT|nr:NADP-specific glutamate dehydrogenase [Desulfotignum phosphitoxidans]EMS78986.1 glutamate dehydrogenase GdhA [Desulfotignum phosphitoxidans DSM 13687]
MSDIRSFVKTKNPGEHEFHQAVDKVLASVQPLIDRHPEYRQEAVLKRITEPEKVFMFSVPWVDDQGQVQMNRGFRVGMNSAIGPYVGGLRFHPSVTLSIMKFLAFEQVFKNALTTMNMGGACGGSDFNPKGKSDREVMRFCQSFMAELHRHIGPDKDILTADIGVGTREIGYLFGMYKKIHSEFAGILTGKSLTLGGSLIRPEATGYGLAYFAGQMLKTQNQTLEGKTCLISGSGNVAQHAAEKLIEMGAKVLTLSDSSGYIFDEEGIDAGKLDYIKRLKNFRRGRIKEYVNKYSEALYVEQDTTLDHQPMWDIAADCAFPCATQNELNARDAQHLLKNKVTLVCEGADMPCEPEAMECFLDAKILYAPGKAANAGGVAVSALEMAQNSMRLSWPRQEVDDRLKTIMKNIHQTCLEAAEEHGFPGNYVAGANIAGFVKVVDAMLDQGVI